MKTKILNKLSKEGREDIIRMENRIREIEREKQDIDNELKELEKE